jgi:hypothetical protein
MVYEPERTESPGRPEPSGQQGPHPAVQLIPPDECDKLALRLQQSLTGFVDGPRHAVEEAAAVLDETAKRVMAALTQRRNSLRDGWQGASEGRSAEADTEELRLALRAYREVTERLLRL